MTEKITPAMRDAIGVLTPAQVADLLQVSRDWVYDQVQAKKIPFVKLGGNVRFRPADLEAYVAGEWKP